MVPLLLLLGMGVGNANVWWCDVVSPMSLLKNPMILIAIVGLGFVFGMPYLLENSTLFPPLPCSFWTAIAL